MHPSPAATVLVVFLYQFCIFFKFTIRRGNIKKNRYFRDRLPLDDEYKCIVFVVKEETFFTFVKKKGTVCRGSGTCNLILLP